MSLPLKVFCFFFSKKKRLLDQPQETPMNYKNLGQSGIRVSPLCLGTMMFGGPADAAVAGRIVAHAREIGINFIDTANVYVQGESEHVTGRLIAAERHWWVLATKLGQQAGPGPQERGLSRLHVMAAVEDSLRRLGTDVIDILYLHREDHGTPLGETVGALADLVRAGKIRHFGLSNFKAWRIAEVCRLCDDLGTGRPVVSQPYYSALNRQAELEQIPACAHFGLGIVPYSPLARGVLTGKYKPGTAPEAESRAGRQDKRLMETEFRPESLEIAQTLAAHARTRGITPGQFAVAWVMANRRITAPIAGPRTEAQWEDYVGALNYRFTPEDEALVDGLVPAGHASSHGYTDPVYPVEGRVL